MAERHPAHRRQAGFTLLEAIVALTLFSLVGLSLFAWLGSNVIALERVQARHAALADARNALAVLETVNPLLEPEGSRLVGTLEVRWLARPVVERRSGIAPAGTQTIFDLALFDLDVEVRRGDGEPQAFSLRRAGWDAVRPAMPEDF